VAPGGPHPRVAVDGILLVDGKLLAVVRGRDPFRGLPALPGGFVELGEPTEAAIVRELKEETGVDARVVRLVGVYSDPRRDPRGHVISVVYELARVDGEPAAGSDAADVRLLDPDALPEMAFDHARIIAAWRGR